MGPSHHRRAAQHWLAVLSGAQPQAGLDSDGAQALLLRRALRHRARALDARVPAATEALFQRVLARVATPSPVQPQRRWRWMAALRHTLGSRAGVGLVLAWVLALPGQDTHPDGRGPGDAREVVRSASGTTVLIAPDPADRLRQLRAALAGTGATLHVQAGVGGALCVWLPASRPALDALADLRLEPAVEAGRITLAIVPMAAPAAAASTGRGADTHLSASCPSG